MKHDEKVTDDELFARTLRTMAALVAACVVFVGTLSLVAVIVTSKAVGAAEASSANKAGATADNERPSI